VGSCRDVQQVILVLGVERVSAREVVQRRVDFLEIPGVAQLDLDAADFGFGRYRLDVRLHTLGQPAAACIMQQLQTMNDQLLLLAEGDRRPPLLPSCATLATVIELRTEKTDDDAPLHVDYP